jgi:hypothetical protein
LILSNKIEANCAAHHLSSIVALRDPTDTRLTASNTGNILTAAICLAAGDRDTGPGPVGTRTRATHNSNVIAAGADSARSGDILDREISDRDTGGRIALEVTTIIVLLDENTVSRDY